MKYIPYIEDLNRDDLIKITGDEAIAEELLAFPNQKVWIPAFKADASYNMIANILVGLAASGICGNTLEKLEGTVIYTVGEELRNYD